MRFSAFSSVCLVALLACVAIGCSAKEVMIALRPTNVNVLENILYDVSNPESPNYGRYLTAEQVSAITAPSNDVIQSIVEFLQNDLEAPSVTVSSGRDYIRATLPDRAANIVLHHLHNSNSVISRLRGAKRVQLNTNERSRIDSIKAHIQLVWDVSTEHNQIDVVEQQNGVSVRRKPVNTFAPLVAGSPNNQKKSYQMPTDMVASSGQNNTQMVWGPGTYGYLKSDLKTYYSEFSVPAHVSDVSTYGFEGTPGGDNFGEATLDVQVITGLAPGVRTYVANTNTSQSTEEGLGFGYAFLDFVQTLTSQPQIPNVLSLSLGSLSADSCEILCQNIQKAGYSEQQCVKYMNEQRQVCMMDSGDQEDLINIAFMKLGARGMTIVAASGDGGSHFSFQPFPDYGIGHALNQVSCSLNFPTFPAASPYVTAIGGTAWKGGDIAHPVSWSASGGGFSWRFPQPFYQAAAVNAYLKANGNTNNFPPQNAFNASNRAYPDLAALADNVPIVIQGSTTPTGGTSASAPAWGGIFSMLNDQRLSKGLPPLGFVNPRLYAIAAAHPGEAFYDVTEGNSACASDGSCCQTGFPATAGWDVTTGLGSPLWPGLVKYLVSN